MAKDLNKRMALEYHAKGRPGKLEVVPTKEAKTQRDLSLAYSPGVAEPCKEILSNPNDIYKYTAKGNLVGVITNGTAVLGLGNIGAAAGKPVMEGKAVLFKIFADIDVFDIEIDEQDPDKFINIVKSLEPTFGGINLEDIKAPECFYIEKKLKEICNIPVMHDDQHGTAIISSAAMLNALHLQKKKIGKAKFVVNGAGAAAMACINLYIELGANPDNFTVFDINGVLHQGREDLEDIKKRIAVPVAKKDYTLSDALKGADMFLGLSVGNVVTKPMIQSMAKNPVVFALANPDPEIMYADAIAARPDVIVATGRSDTPNQVNNVLGFPYIFRGALDVLATGINEQMKLAAVHALAELARTPVPEIVNMAYNLRNISYGREYIIPKPFDPRLLSTVAPAVAHAAIISGVARKPILDWEGYELELNTRMGQDNQLSRVLGNMARQNPKHVVFADGENIKVMRAAQLVLEERVGFPILLGNEDKIHALADEHQVDLEGIPILDPKSDKQDELRKHFGEIFYNKRMRKGVNYYESFKMMKDRSYFGAMMVEVGLADAMIGGLSRKYSDTLKPALQVIGMEAGVKKIAGMYLLFTRKGPLFLADTTVNYNPTAEELADITLMVAKEVKSFNITPRIAMLSYSNFGSSNSPEALLVRKAREIVKQKEPTLVVDGEVQGKLAFDHEVLKENYPFTELLKGQVNTLIFPNLAAGNIAYNLLQEVGGADSIGPILLGMKKPVHVLQLGSSVRNIYNMVVIAVIDAQMKSTGKKGLESLETENKKRNTKATNKNKPD